MHKLTTALFFASRLVLTSMSAQRTFVMRAKAMCRLLCSGVARAVPFPAPASLQSRPVFLVLGFWSWGLGVYGTDASAQLTAVGV